jgi:hypothetical protein
LNRDDLIKRVGDTGSRKVERLAAVGKIFRCAVLSGKEDASLFNHFRVGIVIAFTLNCCGRVYP